MAVPDRVLTNAELTTMVDTSEEWILQRTGIVERRIAGEEETTFTLSLQASRKALEVAGLDPAQLDLIVVATRGRRGLGRLLGSTAKSIQHHANCDVLLVRYTPGE